jgi:hypothetical protein
MTGLAGMGPELATATTPAFSNAAPPSGGLLDWWKDQPQFARDVIASNLGNLSKPAGNLQMPGLPSPAPMNLAPQMGMPGMGQSMAPMPDQSAMAPFLQSLARRQANPYGFGTPSAYFQ